MSDFPVQALLVLLIVGGAVIYVGRRVWRTVAAARSSRGGGCDSSCGCGDAPHGGDRAGS